MGGGEKKIIFVYDRGRVENNRYSLIKNTPGGYIMTLIQFFDSPKMDKIGSMFFYAKYTIRENSYFSEL